MVGVLLRGTGAWSGALEWACASSLSVGLRDSLSMIVPCHARIVGCSLVSKDHGSPHRHAGMRHCSAKAHPTTSGSMTAADAMTQLGKRKRADAPLQQRPPVQTRALTAATSAPAHPTDAISLQPQPGSQMLPFAAASPRQQGTGDAGPAVNEKHHQNAANKLPGSVQPTSDLATGPVTSAAQDAVQTASHSGSQPVPDPDTGQPHDAHTAEPPGPLQGGSPPSMPEKGHSQKDMLYVKPAGPESTTGAHQSEQSRSKHKLPLQEAGSEPVSSKLSGPEKPPDAQGKDTFQQQPTSSKSAGQKAEDARAALSGSASYTSTSGSGSSTGSGSPDRSGSTSDSRSASASDSGSGSGSRSDTPSRRRRSTSDTSSSRSGGYPRRSAPLLSRRSQSSRVPLRSQRGESLTRRIKAVSARTDLKRR